MDAQGWAFLAFKSCSPSPEEVVGLQVLLIQAVYTHHTFSCYKPTLCNPVPRFIHFSRGQGGGREGKAPFVVPIVRPIGRQKPFAGLLQVIQRSTNRTQPTVFHPCSMFAKWGAGEGSIHWQSICFECRRPEVQSLASLDRAGKGLMPQTLESCHSMQRTLIW